VFDHAPTAIATVGLDNRFERVNPAFCALLRLAPDELIGRSMSDISESADSPGDRFALGELVSGRVQQITGTQSFRRPGQASLMATVRRSLAHSATGRQHVVLHVLTAEEGNVLLVTDQNRPATTRPGVLRSAQPVAERGAADPVTGLTSRALLLDRLHLAVARPERNTHFLVMFFVDLSGTERILSRWGRRSLESVLATTGKRLRTAVRAEDTVARFGDGGFVVLCPIVGASSDVVTMRQRLAQAVADGAIHAEGRKFKLTTTIGAAVIGPREACDADDLVEQADRAMAPRPAATGRR
jgi:diguanylate cyclase (GGDEF)-like protein/PAS domain S-box-containing protein